MNDGTKTAVATLLAAIIIASSVAALVPFIGGDEDTGVRTGHFDRFPREFTPEERNIGTPAEFRVEMEGILDEWGTIYTDPASSPEQKEEATRHLNSISKRLATKICLFKAEHYFNDILTNAAEMQDWYALVDTFYKNIPVSPNGRDFGTLPLIFRCSA